MSNNENTMAEREVKIHVPEELFDESARRLRTVGVEQADEMLEAALQASALDRLEIIGGSGPVPTALSDVRAAWLFELCRLCKDILRDEAVGVLFRIMPTTAGSVTRRMQATYEAALDESLRAHMIAVAKKTIPMKAPNEPPKYRVTFATAAAYSHAVRTVAAAGLAGEVTESPAARALEFPQTVKVDRGGKKVTISIAKELGV